MEAVLGLEPAAAIIQTCVGRNERVTVAPGELFGRGRYGELQVVLLGVSCSSSLPCESRVCMR